MSTKGSVADLTTTSRDEAWRYTPVDEIVARMTAAAATTHAIGMSVSRSVVDALAGSHDGPRLVFVNGVYEAELSDHHDLPLGLWCGVAGPHHIHNHIDGRDIAVVVADAGARIDEPVCIVHLATPDHREARASVISRPRTIIDMGEGSVISLLGGGIGIAMGFGMAELATRVWEFPTAVPPNAVVMAFGFSAVTGIFFGFYPARKAAALDPIVALRYE